MRQTKQNGRKKFRKKSTRRLRKKRVMKGGWFFGWSDEEKAQEAESKRLQEEEATKTAEVERLKAEQFAKSQEQAQAKEMLKKQIEQLFDKDGNIIKEKLSEIGTEKTLDFLFDEIMTLIFLNEKRKNSKKDSQKEKTKQILHQIQIIISEISELSDVKKYYCNLAKIFAMRYEYLFDIDKLYFDNLIKEVIPKLHQLDILNKLPKSQELLLDFISIIENYKKKYLSLRTQPDEQNKSEFIESCEF